MKYGFIKVASAVPSVKVADCVQNTKEMEVIIAQAEGRGVEIIVFPELSVTGYTCQDLFREQLLLDAAENSVMALLDFTRQLDIICIVGAPVVAGGLLLNCGIVLQKGKILGIVPKTYLPNYNEFYEKRWFASLQDLREMTIRYAGHMVTLTPAPNSSARPMAPCLVWRFVRTCGPLHLPATTWPWRVPTSCSTSRLPMSFWASMST